MSAASSLMAPTIDPVQIRTDGGTQSRAQIYPAVVSDYADLIGRGAVFPPIVVYFDGTEYWLADGFHRLAAHRSVGLAEIAVDVRQGTRREAILHSVGANSDHGLRRTNEDKRRAVLTLLEDPEWAKWNNREVARRCGVSEFLVRQVRESICDKNADSGVRLVQRGGTTYEQNTSSIGGASPSHTNTEPEFQDSLRQGVTEAARQGFRGNGSTNRNPIYEAPSQAGKAWTHLYGTCRALSEWATDENIELAVRGRSERRDDQTRNVAAVRRALEVLTEIEGMIDG